jgi:hypothetical protein
MIKHLQMYNKTLELLIFSYFYSPKFTVFMEKTIQQYNTVKELCRNLFQKKMQDYGTAWRILRPESITDQIYIKARRIRSIEEKGTSKINEDPGSEFIGIINYALMGIIQLHLGPSEEEMNLEMALEQYDQYFETARTLMMDKNHDYGEAWREMRISSYTDLILMKIKRTKQIEDNLGKTLVSEGIEANYLDMINYAVFALIKIDNETK